MTPQRLFTLGILAVGCLTGAAAAQHYQYNPYGASNPYGYSPQSTAGYYAQPGYGANAYRTPYAASPYGAAGYGMPGYGGQYYGAPSYGASGYGMPGYGGQYYGVPSYGAPSYGASPYAPGYGSAPGYYPPANTQAPGANPGMARPLPPAPAANHGEPVLVAPDRGAVDTLPPAEATALPRYRDHGRGGDILDSGCGGCQPGCQSGGCASAPCGVDCGASCPSDCRDRQPWSAACERACGDLHRCYFNFGALLIRPCWQDNAAFVTFPNPTPGVPQRAGFTDFDYDWALTPRAEVGFQGQGGFGLRARYMYFDQLDSITASAVGATITSAAPLGLTETVPPGGRATVDARLNFHLADFEAQQEWRWGPYWSLRGSAGARYAYLQQNYDYFDTATNGLNAFSHFSGGGLTSAFELRRNFPRCHLNVFTIGRGSLLYGCYAQKVNTSVGGFVNAEAERTEQGILPMGELEAGLEWSCFINKCRFFVSTGAFGQVWFSAGNTSDSSPVTTFAGYEGNSLSRRDLLLIGATLTVGLEF